MRKAKIVATLGPATPDQTTIEALVTAGVNVFRINMSHGDYDSANRFFDMARQAGQELQQPLAILIDLAGPKIRTGKLEGGQSVQLYANDLFTITSRDVLGTNKEISVNYPEIILHAKPGTRLLFEDGAIEMTVEQTTDTDLICRVLNDGLLGEHKGINLPGLRLPIPSLTEKDRKDLAWATNKGADFIGLSFVRTSDDCRQAQDLIRANGGQAQLIAKIEMAEAIANIDAIIEAADAVMVARGDLGVETSVELVPVYQKMIIEKANLAGKTVITATQMLQSMIHELRPTRAEASDVANAIWDGSDAVMLSNETAVGGHPLVAAKTMARIIEEAEAGRPITRPKRRRSLLGGLDRFQHALSSASLLAAEEGSTQTISIITETGQMARSVAMLRPMQRIIALTLSPHIANQLALTWGVESIVHPPCQTTDELIATSERALLERGIATEGERIVLMAGRLSGLGLSSSIKLHVIGNHEMSLKTKLAVPVKTNRDHQSPA